MSKNEELSGLIAGLKAGRDEAYEAFVRHYWEYLSRVVSRFVPSASADGEDWVEVILIHALNQIVNGKVRFISAPSFNAWLNRVAGRKCIELWHKQQRMKDGMEGDGQLASNPDPNAKPPSKRLELHELRHVVLEAIDQIPKENLRETLRMFWCEGLTLEEIACRINKPLSTIRTWERRGKMMLRKIIERNYPDLAEEFGGG